MTEILLYIERLKKCGLGKQKSLEFLEKFCELRQTESPYMWFCDNDCDCDNCKSRCSIWQKGYNTAKDKCEEKQRKATTISQASYCKRWANAMMAEEDACVEWEEEE